MSTQSASVDTALLERARGGDDNAFSELASRHNQLIYRVSLRMLRNREDAEDNAQNTMFKAFLRIKQFKSESRFSTWLVRIAINEALMFLRRPRVIFEEQSQDEREGAKGGLAGLADATPSPESQCATRELAQKALGELSPTMQTIFTLQKLHGWTIVEVANDLGITRQTVKYRTFRARRIMQDRLQALAAGL